MAGSVNQIKFIKLAVFCFVIKLNRMSLNLYEQLLKNLLYVLCLQTKLFILRIVIFKFFQIIHHNLFIMLIFIKQTIYIIKRQ